MWKCGGVFHNLLLSDQANTLKVYTAILLQQECSYYTVHSQATYQKKCAHSKMVQSNEQQQIRERSQRLKDMIHEYITRASVSCSNNGI